MMHHRQTSLSIRSWADELPKPRFSCLPPGAATEPGLDPKKRAGRYELDHFTTYQSRHISLANAAGSRRARKTQSLYNSFAATEIWDPGPGRRTGWAVAWQNRILFPCDFMLTCRICRILLRNAVPSNLRAWGMGPYLGNNGAGLSS